MGFKQAVRGRAVSISAVVLISITLSVLALVGSFSLVARGAISGLEEKLDVTIYFKDGTTIEILEEVAQVVRAYPEVKNVDTTTADEALAIFEENHQNEPLTMQALREVGENPFFSTIQIQAEDPSFYESIVADLDTGTGISGEAYNQINKIDFIDNREVIEKFDNLIEGITRLGAITGIVFLLIGLFTMVHALRLSGMRFKEQMDVMSLVGADKKYINGPLIAQGAYYGAFSAVVSFIGLSILFKVADVRLAQFLNLDLIGFWRQNILQAVALLFVFGITFSVIAAYLATRKLTKRA